MKILDVPQSGSLAGQTSSRNRYGQYRRTRAMPTQPRTAAQTNIRAILAGCSSNWSSLTPNEQLAWSAWAELHPKTDSLGQVVVMTGAQAFNAVNCLLVSLSMSAVSAPPADPLPDPPSLAPGFLPDDGAWEIEFTPTGVSGGQIVLYNSPPQSLGTLFCGDFRFNSKWSTVTTSPNTGFYAQWQAKFGDGVIGQRVFFRARQIRTDGGFSSFSNTLFMDVEAA
jgi:hypothetical protein